MRDGQSGCILYLIKDYRGLKFIEKSAGVTVNPGYHIRVFEQDIVCLRIDTFQQGGFTALSRPRQ